jgi:hypothetical protein
MVECSTEHLKSYQGQAQQFLLEYIAKLFPNCQPTWERFEEDLDVDELFLKESNSGDEKAKKEKGGNEEGKKDKVLEAVDSGCSGLLFLRFRVDVTPTYFMQKLIGRN